MPWIHKACGGKVIFKTINEQIHEVLEDGKRIYNGKRITDIYVCDKCGVELGSNLPRSSIKWEDKE